MTCALAEYQLFEKESVKVSMFGSLIVITSTAGIAVPMLWPLVVAAAGASGYRQLTSSSDDALLRGEITSEIAHQKTVEVSLEHKIIEVVEEQVDRDRTLRFVKGDVTVAFKRDLRGKFSVQVSGPDTMSRRELEYMGRDFLGTIIQQFAYNRMAEEMERRGANIIGEEVNENGDIVLKLRRWD